MNARSMLVAVYQNKPTPHQTPGGYWFLRVVNPSTGAVVETVITYNKAVELKTMGVPQLADGGGL